MVDIVKDFGNLLWTTSPTERLKAARALYTAQVERLQTALCADCPVEPWPYGITTPVNPFLVTLGPSPGASPAGGDLDYHTRGPQPLPPAGAPHNGAVYVDPRGLLG